MSADSDIQDEQTEDNKRIVGPLTRRTTLKRAAGITGFAGLGLVGFTAFFAGEAAAADVGEFSIEGSEVDTADGRVSEVTVTIDEFDIDYSNFSDEEGEFDVTLSAELDQDGSPGEQELDTESVGVDEIPHGTATPGGIKEESYDLLDAGVADTEDLEVPQSETAEFTFVVRAEIDYTGEESEDISEFDETTRFDLTVENVEGEVEVTIEGSTDAEPETAPEGADSDEE